jgi:hypothetical protein
MKKFVLALGFAAVSWGALANDSLGPVVQPLIVTAGSGIGIFGVGPSGSFGGAKPACATLGLETYWAFDVKTAQGKAAYSTVLLAYALGKKLRVIGTGNCDVWGDRESVNYLFIAD